MTGWTCTKANGGDKQNSAKSGHLVSLCNRVDSVTGKVEKLHAASLMGIQKAQENSILRLYRDYDIRCVIIALIEQVMIVN
tara:strand:+ start:3868 stop:4110 length:243 start_codon:yes stop_codon:yes gene_type:complete